MFYLVGTTEIGQDRGPLAGSGRPEGHGALTEHDGLVDVAGRSAELAADAQAEAQIIEDPAFLRCVWRMRGERLPAQHHRAREIRDIPENLEPGAQDVGQVAEDAGPVRQGGGRRPSRTVRGGPQPERDGPVQISPVAGPGMAGQQRDGLQRQSRREFGTGTGTSQGGQLIAGLIQQGQATSLLGVLDLVDNAVVSFRPRAARRPGTFSHARPRPRELP